VALWGRNPVDADARAGYFDSLHHAAAVVGLNTSAFLEAAIAGRHVHAPLLPEHHDNQEGTIHFHYLLDVAGGLLTTARSLAEHFAQLNHTLRAGSRESERSRRFVEAFIRPHGADVAATPVLVEAIEALASVRAPAPATAGSPVLRALLAPLARAATLPLLEPLMSSSHERAITARQRAHRERVAAAWREKDAHTAAEDQAKAAKVAARARYKAQRAAGLRRAKTMTKITHRIKKRIGLAS
jgi:hypothetical protein